MDWIAENSAWVFSGVGIAVPLAIIGWIFFSKSKSQIQKGGDNSTNVQVSGNIIINSKKSND